tara:strand:+ start:297 stop:461 length:165 start_codon:yes stop_codon:yes gene_type:complete
MISVLAVRASASVLSSRGARRVSGAACVARDHIRREVNVRQLAACIKMQIGTLK